MFITDLLDDLEARYPDKVAIVEEKRSITFLQLNQQTYNLAVYLTFLGIDSGQRVALLLPNCLEYATCFIAPLRIGAVSVPLNPYQSLMDLQDIFIDSTLSALIITSKRPDVLEYVKKMPHLKVIIINDQSLQRLLYKKVEKRLSTRVSSEDDAVYMYTSGTTGKPKGVVLTHGIIARRGMNNRKLNMSSNDNCYTVGDLYHNGKLFVGLVWSLYLGMTFYTDNEFHPQKTLEKLVANKITFFLASPFHYGILANWQGFNNIPKLSSLRLCLSSGNKLEPDINLMFSRRFNVSITENYGITEAGGICTNGFPHNNVIIKIIDEKENELGINQIGEIIVSGPGKAKGYLNQPHLTSKVFKNNFFYTGDLGKIDEKGKLQILCRKKNIINLKDKEIYPDEIIEVLCGHPNVKNALVRKNANEWLEAIVTLNKSCSAENLIEYCQKHLDEHKIPKNIKIQESLPYLWQLAIDSNNFNLHKLKGKA